jgi:hypothetical protein
MRVGFVTMRKIIDEMSKQQYKINCHEYFEKIKNIYYFDDMQIDTIERIIDTKRKNERIDINLDFLTERKKCPHCGAINKAPLGTSYIVCGVDTMGKKSINEFNLTDTCLNDWCFQCGKKLCKHWFKVELYNVQNRKHNGECCRQHAKKNGFIYPDDYCQCYII